MKSLLDLLAEGAEWRERAACRGSDPDLFFPEKDQQAQVQVEEAKAVCSTCPVRAPCLEYALTAREKQGVWGGTSDNDRRAIRRQRKEAELERARAAAEAEEAAKRKAAAKVRSNKQAGNRTARANSKNAARPQQSRRRAG